MTATPEGSGSQDGRDEADQPPVMPTADEAARRREELPRPAVVRYALVVWVAAGAVGVLNALVLMFTKDELVSALIKANRNPSITNEQIADGATTLVWTILVIGLSFAALFTLFAYKAQQGLRRARLTLALLCAVAVLFYYLLMRTTLGLLSGLLAVAGAVLLYLPQAREYFRADPNMR